MEMTIIIGILAFVVAAVVGYFVSISTAKKQSAKIIADAEAKGKIIISDAEKQAEHIKKEKLLEVKEEWHKRKTEFDQEKKCQTSKNSSSRTTTQKA